MISKNQEAQYMEFNGYNFKAEWNISNFQSNQAEYYSPMYICDKFQVKFTLYNSSLGNINQMTILFSIFTAQGNLSLQSTLIISNKDSKKSIRIGSNELIFKSEKDIEIPCRIQSNDITSENGYLQDGSLQIVVFFIPTEIPLYIVKYKTSWYINENISDFHTTYDPLSIKISKKQVNFAATFEKNENENYTFSIYLIDPEISFEGELEVILNNENRSKNISKSKTVKFDQNCFDIDQFTFDLKEEDLSDPNNGWIVYDSETNEVKIGVHFTIIFKLAQIDKRNEVMKIFDHFDDIQVRNVSYLIPERPFNIKPDESGQFSIELKYSKNENFSSPIQSKLYHVGEFIIRLILDLPRGKMIIRVEDSLYEKNILFYDCTIVNSNPKLTYTKSFESHFNSKKEELSFDLPFTNEESKEWFVDDFLNVMFHFDGSEFDAKWIEYYNYNIFPVVESNFGGCDFYVPISLFEGESCCDQIMLNPLVVNNFTIQMIINYEIESNKLILKPKLKTENENCLVLHINATIENKDPSNNICVYICNALSSQYTMREILPEKSLEEDGYTFYRESSKENIKATIKFYTECKENDFSQCNDDNLMRYIKKAKMKANKDNDLEIDDEIPIEINMLKNEIFNRAALLIADSQNNHDIAAQLNNDTGYVGLKNQGATCYLNSLLQSLFHLPAFRKLVYEMPTLATEEKEEESKSIPLNLQRLFYQMQFSGLPCDTSDLTKSFGWGRSEIFQQHDIEEFLRVLIENLENKMKGTKLEDSLQKLLRGRYRSYIKCKNVDYQAVKEESFYDLSIDVLGLQNLYDSFAHYVRQEELVGENQYETPSFGKQDAIMGIEFIEFPPVLHIQLRRFMFDTKQNKMIKINDRFEFPETIDLTDFLANDSPDKGRSNVYDLYGVLVHDGLGYSGHYYAHLRTSTSLQWYKFNDIFVSKDTTENSVLNNYGNNSTYELDKEMQTKSTHSGYLLIYVRKEVAESIFEPIKEESIPEHLKKLNENVKAQFVMESILKTNFINRINGFFSSQMINEYNNKKHPDHSFIELLNKSMKISEIYSLIADKVKVEPSRIRLWNCTSNNSPQTVIPNSDQLDICHFFDCKSKIKIFVQTTKKENDEKLQIECSSNSHNNNNSILIFIMFFFSEELLRKQSVESSSENLIKQIEDPLQYLFSVDVNLNDNVDSLLESINKQLGFPLNSKLEVNQIESNGSLRKISLESSFSSNNVSCGSILVFQMKEESIDKIPKNSLKIDFPFVFEDQNEKEKLFKYEDSEMIHDSLKSFENFIKSDYGFYSRKLTDNNEKKGKSHNELKIFN